MLLRHPWPACTSPGQRVLVAAESGGGSSPGGSGRERLGLLAQTWRTDHCRICRNDSNNPLEGGCANSQNFRKLEICATITIRLVDPNDINRRHGLSPRFDGCCRRGTCFACSQAWRGTMKVQAHMPNLLKAFAGSAPYGRPSNRE